MSLSLRAGLSAAVPARRAGWQSWRAPARWCIT